MNEFNKKKLKLIKKFYQAQNQINEFIFRK